MNRVGLGRHGKIADNAGDPLDGLVNLFDIGIVLAVAFLIAGLVVTTGSRGGSDERRDEARARVLPKSSGGHRAHGQGEPVGTVYRLADGRLVIVSGGDARRGEGEP